jgi:hypothetical protein
VWIASAGSVAALHAPLPIRAAGRQAPHLPSLPRQPLLAGSLGPYPGMLPPAAAELLGSCRQGRRANSPGRCRGGEVTGCQCV